MTDDQLSRELERRSESATLGHDWARDRLLPGVNAVIDTHPQRVASSRGPAVAGLAGVVAILLVLVVALPRIVPGPSTTASPPAPGVMDAATFAARLATGELNGKTVLVDGRVERHDTDGIPYGSICWQEPVQPPPHGDCELGRLSGVDQLIWVNAPYVETLDSLRPINAQPGDWSWRAAQPPVEGRLVLSISTAGVIEYLGTVLSSNPDAISVNSANQVSIDTLSPTDVALVKGWLWSPEPVAISCAAPRSSPVPGLPNDYCQPHDSLLDAPAGPGSVDPPDPRLKVQQNAARRYGLDDGQPHVFVLAPRLYGGDCAGQPPCLQWEVVARLSDSPGQRTEPTLSPEPTSARVSGVLETADFATRLATGELNRQTVLVNGRIGLNMRRGGRYCAPTDLCYLGPLEGPALDVFAHGTPSTATADSSQVAGAAWPWWQPFLPPIEGTLILSVSDSGAIEYVGHARPGSRSTFWSAADAAQLDVNTLAQDEVVVVDGWLTGSLLIPPCAAPAEGTYIPSLPGRWCGGPDWVLDQPISFTAGSPIPEGGIAVQDGAYEDFAPNPTQGATVGEPRQGKYLLARRLEGGGCPNDAPPCWQWEVVGRLSDAVLPDTTPPTPDATAPTRSMDCPGLFPLSLTDLSGDVVSCSAMGDVDYHQIGEQLINPDGDLSRLQIRWGLNICVASTTVEFSRTESGYSVVVTDGSNSPDCMPHPNARAFELRFDTDVPAAMVSFHVITAPVPTPSPESRNVGCPIDRSSPESQLAPHVSLLDQTGLISDCAALGGMPDFMVIGWSEVVVRNSGPNQLEVVWRGTECDLHADVTVSGDATALVAAVHLTDDYSSDTFVCTSASAGYLVLNMAAPIDAATATASIERASQVPDPHPPPSPPPTGDPALMGQTVACPYQASVGRPSEISIIDHGGFIIGCQASTTAETPIDRIVLSNGVDPTQLDFRWQVDAVCASMPAQLEFWGPWRFDDPRSWTTPNYRLRVDVQSSPSPETNTCGDTIGTQGFVLTLNQAIPAEKVIAFDTHGATSDDSVNTPVGRFDFSLTAGAADYAAETPIDISATLTYSGATPVTIEGDSEFIVFGFEQLDGHLGTSPVSRLMCGSHDLQPNQSVVVGFQKAGGYSGSSPDADWYRQYFNDPELKLPPGTYRIWASVGFHVGRGTCYDLPGGYGLSASIVINVQ